jgi:hypothetical protein
MDANQRKARRALERRFGQSVLPYRFARIPGSRLVIRCTDDESGSWVDVDFTGPRARVVAEWDAAS